MIERSIPVRPLAAPFPIRLAMPNINNNSFIFSSESVGAGHPDKVADYISDSILDECLEDDPDSRVACETLVKSDQVVIAGEITTKSQFDYEEVVRQAIREIGYVHNDDKFHADKVKITNFLTTQSPDIAQGVDAREAEGKKTDEQGAGDQGIMFGYACNETAEYMPAAIQFAHKLNRGIAQMRQAEEGAWIRPDCKSQVSVRYEGGQVKQIENVIISVQHSPEITYSEIETFVIEKVIKTLLPKELLTSDTEYLINPTGRFVVGGPEGDAGVTGRKIIVDTYGGWSRHGGGAFSGKDPSKVDRSAAYMMRWVAKNVVAAGLAERCELQVAYAIGHPEPTSIYINTFGTSSHSSEVLVEAVKKVFSFKPAAIIEQLQLKAPIYKMTTNYGHFAKAGLPWEETDKVEELLNALG